MKPVAESGSRLAVIPARGGSERIVGKNIRPLLGRPLISYTIEAAVESGLFHRVVVSTDDREIARVAVQCGAEVPFLRDARLADSTTLSSSVTLDALRRTDPGTEYSSVAQLLPTSPLRTAQDICDSFVAFRRRDSPAQISVTAYTPWNPWWARKVNPDGTLEPLFPGRSMQRGQDLPRIACPTGAVWWARAATLRQAETFYAPGHTGWMMDWDHAIDIDTEDDWRMAEMILRDRAATA